MNTNRTKLQQRQNEETVEQQSETTSQQVHEFPTAEAAIRCDAATIEVPPEVESRLAESIQKEQSAEPEAPTPWWKRLFL